MMKTSLSENERCALELLVHAGGSVLTTSVPDKNSRDVVFDTAIPGHGVYRKLEKRGFVFYSVEDPIDLPGDPIDGFVFTNEIYITDEGRDVLKVARKN